MTRSALTRFGSIAAGALLLFAWVTESLAAPITVPTELDVGDEYRLVFVTSEWTTATSTSIADYNSFVQSAANAVPQLLALNTTWTAIASTTTVDARDNTATNGTGVPIYNLGDTRIADDYSDLWDGSLIAPIQYDENGNLAAWNRAWTGSDIDGTGYTDHELGTVTPRLGYANNVGSSWVTHENDYHFDGAQSYALGDILVVVPEPGTAALMVMGFAVLALRVKRQGH